MCHWRFRCSTTATVDTTKFTAPTPESCPSSSPPSPQRSPGATLARKAYHSGGGMPGPAVPLKHPKVAAVALASLFSSARCLVFSCFLFRRCQRWKQRRRERRGRETALSLQKATSQTTRVPTLSSSSSSFGQFPVGGPGRGRCSRCPSADSCRPFINHRMLLLSCAGAPLYRLSWLDSTLPSL